MSTAVHVLRKDVRRHAWWLCVWFLACVTPFVLRAVTLNWAGIAAQKREPTGTELAIIVTKGAILLACPWVQLALFTMLIVLVVHEDPIVDSTAFWMTRPIGGQRLVAGKLLFVGGLLVLPAVAGDVAEIALTALGWRYVLLAVPQVVLEWTLWASGIMALASLTTTTRGFMATLFRVGLLAIPVVLVVQLGMPMLVKGLSLRDALGGAFEHGKDQLAFDAPASRIASRAIARMAIGVAAATGVVLVQYLTRRTRVAWALVVIGMAATNWSKTGWRWDVLGLVSAIASHEEVADVGAKARLIVRSIELAPEKLNRPLGLNEPQPYNGTAILVFEGVREPLVPDVVGLVGSFTLANGHELQLHGHVAPSDRSDAGWNVDAVRSLLGPVRIIGMEPGSVRINMWADVDPEDATLLASPGALTIVADVRLRRYRLAGELPLDEGAEYQGPGMRASIDHVQNRSADFTVLVGETRLSLLLAPGTLAASRNFGSSDLYLLRNRQRGEALWPVTNRKVRSGLRSLVDEADLQLSFNRDDSSPHLDDAWLAGADLVRIEAATVGGFKQTVVVPDFRIASSQASP
jgi:hypothetical protein